MKRPARGKALAHARLRVKRAYDPPHREDGFRVLVDRLWPRGLPKERAHVDLWLKDIAPSSELRRWYGHDPKRWDEFRRRYRAELGSKTELFRPIREALERGGAVTLLFAAHDIEHNNAVALVTFTEDGTFS